MNDIILHKAPHRWPLVLIALDKLVKAIGLVVASVFLRALMNPDRHEALEDWLEAARIEPHNWFIHRIQDLIGHVLGIQPQALHLLHIGVIAAAAIYLIEGVGLYFQQKWAEWVVAISTALFLPAEIYEIFLKVTWFRCVLFLGNLLIALYLAWRLRREMVIKHELAEHPELAVKASPVAGGR